ncbi:MAG: hypothetical protein L0H54_08440, partial [Alcaligenaceae bacterium]|nr:hypothetical protein [Alcaligenaceae bacterium]
GAAIGHGGKWRDGHCTKFNVLSCGRQAWPTAFQAEKHYSAVFAAKLIINGKRTWRNFST